MRGDRRCSSFRKEKPAGLSRALSWLNVSNLGRQSRRIFRSQSELHRIHGHPAQAQQALFTHLRRSKHGGSSSDDDDDDWVYHPQHRKGEGRPETLSLGSLFPRAEPGSRAEPSEKWVRVFGVGPPSSSLDAGSAWVCRMCVARDMSTTVGQGSGNRRCHGG